MYEKFYGLNLTPFSKSTPISSLYLTESHSEVLSRLVYAAKGRLFAVVTGDCGTGKTSVIRKLYDTLDEKKFEFLYIADSQLTPRNFYNGLLAQLGREGAFYRGDSKRKLHQEIELLQGIRHRELVVTVDEAHLLNQEMLEELRFLLNFKMDSLNPLALILSGQTELEERLSRRSSTAIRQRIDFHCRLSPLNLAETGKYIEHHLRSAGAQKMIFQESAVKEIFAFSAGSARLINKLCSNCLLYGFINYLNEIDENAIKEIVENELKYLN
jgi:type II secretory pathway predicted ATPase ExeA